MDLGTAEGAFGQLLREWTQLQRLAKKEALETWEPAIKAMTDEETALRSQGQWVRGAADMFGVLGIGRAEVRHTKLIAWLMDPSARHGLGTRFLELILQRTFPEERFEGLDRANPSCEVVRARCRADIVVSSPSFTIVIEAKIDAEEGDRQCDYQHQQFDENGSRFIFLTPRGRPPRTATGDAKEAFRALSFAGLRDDLRAALAGGAPMPGRAAAENYLLTLEREFPWPT